MTRRSLRLLAASLALAASSAENATSRLGLDVDNCPGAIDVGGVGRTSIVATQWNIPGMRAGPVYMEGSKVVPTMWGRAYFANSCTPGEYHYSRYSGIPLLGKKISYMIDLSQAGCGCNAAFYLVLMNKNPQVSGCSDYYCDANSVCEINCDEIDIMEANKFAFHSAVHKEYDGNGISQGFGGYTEGDYAFTGQEYGPGARCIDTNKPFRVTSSFPKGPNGKMRALETSLTQDGSPCPPLSLALREYRTDPGWEHLSGSLEVGMTPVVSYWKAENMLWLDGPGNSVRGPCKADDNQCGADGTGPKFYDFVVEDLSVRFI